MYYNCSQAATLSRYFLYDSIMHYRKYKTEFITKHNIFHLFGPDCLLPSIKYIRISYEYRKFGEVAIDIVVFFCCNTDAYYTVFIVKPVKVCSLIAKLYPGYKNLPFGMLLLKCDFCNLVD